MLLTGVLLGLTGHITNTMRGVGGDGPTFFGFLLALIGLAGWIYAFIDESPKLLRKKDQHGGGQESTR